MRSLLVAIVLWGSAVLAVEPRAVLTGPTSAAVDTDVWVRFAGSVADEPLEFEVAGGPDGALVEIGYSSQGLPLFACVRAIRPGQYLLVLVATGTPPPPGVAPVPVGPVKPHRSYAFLWVNVGTLPPPVPPPSPPTPPVPPGPSPVTGKLFAIAVYPADVQPTAEAFAFAAVKDDPTLVATLQAMDVVWHAWPSTDARLDSLKVRPYVQGLGSPQILLYDAQGNVYGPDGVVATRQQGKAFKAPLTVDETVALFKKLRGK